MFLHTKIMVQKQFRSAALALEGPGAAAARGQRRLDSPPRVGISTATAAAQAAPAPKPPSATRSFTPASGDIGWAATGHAAVAGNVCKHAWSAFW